MVSIHPHASEKILHQVQKKDLIRDLWDFLPDSAILSDTEELKPYECDGLAA